MRIGFVSADAGFVFVAQTHSCLCRASFLRKQAQAGEPPPHHANTARGGDPGAGPTRAWSRPFQR